MTQQWEHLLCIGKWLLRAADLVPGLGGGGLEGRSDLRAGPGKIAVRPRDVFFQYIFTLHLLLMGC